MVKKIASFLARHEIAAFVAGVVLLGCSAFWLKVPEVDGSFATLGADDNVYVKNMETMDSIFRRYDVLYFHIEPERASTGEVLEGVAAFRDSLRAVTDSLLIFPLGKTIELLGEEDGQPFNRTLVKLSAVPVINQVISKDKRSFILPAEVRTAIPPDVDRIDQLLQQKYKGIRKIASSSRYHIENDVKKAVGHDLRLLSVVIGVLFTLILFFAYNRRLKPLLYCLIILGACQLASIAVIGITADKINMITVLTLPAVLVLTLSDALHLSTTYISDRQGTHRERVARAIERVIVPSFLTSITTAVSFYSFCYSPLTSISDFGWMTGHCLILEFVFTFLLSPFLLRLLTKLESLEGLVMRASRATYSMHRGIAIGIFSVSALSLLFINKVGFDSSFEDFMPAGSKHHEVHNVIMNKFHSQVKLFIGIRDNQPAPIGNVVKEMAGKLEKHPNVVMVNHAFLEYEVTSDLGLDNYNLLDVLKITDRYRSRDGSWQIAEVLVNNPDSIPSIYNSIAADLTRSKQQFIASSPELIGDEVNEQVASTLLRSMFSSCIFMFLVFLVLTRNLRVSLISIFVNLFPVTIILPLFYFSGLQFNILTSLTIVVCSGTIVDDSMHVLYKTGRKKEPLGNLSFSILLASIVLVAGFGAFLFSSFTPTRVFGGVAAFIFAFAVFVDLAVLPNWINRNLAPR